MSPEFIDQIKQIIKQEMQENYTSGVPRIPPHQHDGVDNLRINASDLLGSVGNPGGDNTDVQFNDGGVFGGDSGLTYDKTATSIDGTVGILTVNVINSDATDGFKALEIYTPFVDTDFSSGNVEITTGATSLDSAGSGIITIKTGNATGQFDSSGAINVNTGDIGDGSQGGDITLETGGATSTGTGSNSGDVIIRSGVVNGDNCGAGSVNIHGGDINSGNGSNPGSVNISGGVSKGTFAGTGDITIGGGSRIGTGSAGNVEIRGGVGAVSGNVDGGNISVTGGTHRGTAIDGNLSIHSSIISASFGGGGKVIYIADATTIPTVTPSGGGILYSTGGALHWLGSSGTDTPIAPA